MSDTTTAPTTALALPGDFQDRVFKAIAVQRPAVIAFIKEIRRKDPSASPAEVMKKIESQYLATITTASAAAGATSTIPAVGIGIAVGLGVADLVFFYETTALFALCTAELRAIPIDDPQRAKAVVLGALLGEKRNSPVTGIVLSALPAGATIAGARDAAGKVAAGANPKWGDLLAQQLPDSALVPVAMVLAREFFVKEGSKAAVKIGSKAIPLPLVGAVAGGATSLFFGNSVVKGCREGFSAPADTWPEWLELTYSDGSDEPEPSRAVLAMRAAADSAKELGEGAWSKLYDATDVFRSVDLDGDGVPDEARALTALKGASTAVGAATGDAAKAVGAAAGGAAKSLGSFASGAKGSLSGALRRGKRDGVEAPEG
ncbi:hypothetical protein [Demequina phytophila]|uniref:hypothetical protein n=1 Tax=Demequina phytophila TaxID=1638981 RepID=UPI000B2857AD|nr:hypothetical protein [Demequina phytophila]